MNSHDRRYLLGEEPVPILPGEARMEVPASALIGAVIVPHGCTQLQAVISESGARIDLPAGIRAIAQPDGGVMLELETAAGPGVAVSSHAWVPVAGGRMPNMGEEVLVWTHRGYLDLFKWDRKRNADDCTEMCWWARDERIKNEDWYPASIVPAYWASIRLPDGIVNHWGRVPERTEER
jgi:hypothetical protein